MAEEGPTLPTTLIPDLLSRCTFPAEGAPLACAVSGGADSLALLVLAAAAGCAVTAIHVDHGLRAGSEAEAEVVPSGGGALRRPVREPPGVRRSRGPTSRPGPGRPASPSCRPTWPPGTPWTTRPRRSSSTCCAGRGPTGWRAWSRGHGTRSSDCAGTRPTRCAPRPVCSRCATRATTTRRSSATASATSSCRLCAEVAGRDPVPLLARQAGVLRDEVALLDSLAAELLPDPADARAVAPRPSARWRAGPCGAGCGRPATGSTRRRWPRSTAPWPWRRARRWGRS